MLGQKNGQKWPKMTPKMNIFWHFFNFFQKILVLMPPKLLCIFGLSCQHILKAVAIYRQYPAKK